MATGSAPFNPNVSYSSGGNNHNNNNNSGHNGRGRSRSTHHNRTSSMTSQRSMRTTTMGADDDEGMNFDGDSYHFSTPRNEADNVNSGGFGDEYDDDEL